MAFPVWSAPATPKGPLPGEVGPTAASIAARQPYVALGMHWKWSEADGRYEIWSPAMDPAATPLNQLGFYPEASASIFDKVGSAVSGAAKSIAKVVAKVPGLSSAAVVATGGLAAIDPGVRKGAATDFAIGAATGATILGVGALAKALPAVSAPSIQPSPATVPPSPGAGGQAGDGAPGPTSDRAPLASLGPLLLLGAGLVVVALVLLAVQGRK